MITERSNIEKFAPDEKKEVNEVRAFIHKTKVQNEALKKIISTLDKEKLTKENNL